MRWHASTQWLIAKCHLYARTIPGADSTSTQHSSEKEGNVNGIVKPLVRQSVAAGSGSGSCAQTGEGEGKGCKGDPEYGKAVIWKET